MEYEITIRQLEPYTTEEEDKVQMGRKYPIDTFPSSKFSDRNYHEKRVLQTKISAEEFEAVKKAIIGVL